MKKTFKVERNGKQTWAVVRQMPHDTQYAVGSRIPGLGRVIEIRATEINISADMVRRGYKGEPR